VKQLADALYQLGAFPPNMINTYLMGGVLVDARTKWDTRPILKQLKGHTVTAHALTHAHPDHQGASHAICERLGIELWCGAGDVDAMENGTIREHQPAHFMNTLFDKILTGPPHPVARALREGDEVGGFKVLDVPGHSAGHVAFWRESDRALVLGDVLANQHQLTSWPGLHWPLKMFTPDPERNRESARRLADLEPALVCFGHGPPLRDTQKFVQFVR
jgi:hydroxyacylglutathione hydrolase